MQCREARRSAIFISLFKTTIGMPFTNPLNPSKPSSPEIGITFIPLASRISCTLDYRIQAQLPLLPNLLGTFHHILRQRKNYVAFRLLLSIVASLPRISLSISR